MLEKNFAKFLRTLFSRTPPVAASPQSLIRALQNRQKKERKILHIRLLPKWVYRFERILFFSILCLFSETWFYRFPDRLILGKLIYVLEASTGGVL